MWLTGLVNIVFFVAEVLLLLRFVLRLFGADSSTPFVSWIMETSQPLLAPFAGMFPTPVLEGGFVLEFTTLFALVIFELARFLITRFIRWIGSLGEDERSYRESDELEQRERERDRIRAKEYHA